jgi:hypothetical protein
MSHVNLLVALIRNVQTIVAREPKLPSIAKGLWSVAICCASVSSFTPSTALHIEKIV